MVVAGIVVVAVGVALALLSGGGTPPAEELGASLSQAYSAFHSTSPTSNGQGTTTAPATTTPAAAAPAPVGDPASAATTTKSPSYNLGQTEDEDPPGSIPAPVCPGTSPDCGPFRWDSAPAPNQPQVEPVWDPSVAPGDGNRFHLTVGQVFTVTVSAEDPDSEFPSCWITANSTGGVVDPIACTHEAKVLYPGEYGAHRVPQPTHGKAGPIAVTVHYTEPGDYDLTFTTTSGLYAQCGVASQVNCNPYGDSATVTIPITVTAS